MPLHNRNDKLRASVLKIIMAQLLRFRGIMKLRYI